jgi:hypothetical protein
MTEQKPRELWIKITSFDKVEMGGFRYSDAEISIDPDCGKNYSDFKNAIHVVEASALAAAKAEIEMLKIKLGLMTENELVLKDKIERLKETLSYYPKIRF